MPTVEIPGATLHYESTGSGSPLVLLLPQSSGPRGIHAAVEGLAQSHNVIRYDQRGIGQSTPAPGPLSMADQAADVVALLDALGLERAHMVCHSTGCGIGFCLAARHSERVKGLAVAAPWTHADPFLTAMQTLRTAAARVLDPVQYARFNAAVLFPPAYRRANEAGFTELAEQAPAQPQDAEVFAHRLQAILDFDARPLWPAISSPTLVMVAGDDQLMPPWFAAEAAAGIRAAKLIEFASGGHMLLETSPDRFVAAVLEFLAGVDARM